LLSSVNAEEKSEWFVRKQCACLCKTAHPENAFHGQRGSWHVQQDGNNLWW